MNVFALIVFLAVFCCVLIVYIGMQAAPKARRKRTQERLAEIPQKVQEAEPDVLDAILRDDTISSVAWLDRVLRQIGLVGQLRNYWSGRVEVDRTAALHLCRSLGRWMFPGSIPPH